MKKREFKVGQEVTCIDNPNRRPGDEYLDGRGYGWKLGKIFKITEISKPLKMYKNQRILWDNNIGVFEDNVSVDNEIQKKLE